MVYHQKFFCKHVLMLVPNTPTIRLHGVVTRGELRLPSVFIIRESFWTPGSHFTDFKKHTTIFKWTIIPKLGCKLF